MSSRRWTLPLLTMVVVTVLAQAAAAQILSAVVMRQTSDARGPRTSRYGPNDTFYLFFDIEGATSGDLAVELHHAGQIVYTVHQKLNRNPHWSFPLARVGQQPWQPGEYSAEVLVNGRRLGGDAWMVYDSDRYVRPQPEVQPQTYSNRYNTRAGAQEVAGRWVYAKALAGGRSVVHVIAIAPTGQYEVTEGGKVVETGQITALQGQMTFQSSSTSSGRPNAGRVTYFIRGDSLTLRDGGGKGLTWYREGSREGQALLENVAVTQPSPEVKRPTTAIVEHLQITGTYKYSSRDDGPQDPSTSFGAFEDIHCGIRGTLRKGSRIEALLRDRDGREVMKMSLDPMARDVAIEKYSIPFRHPKQALTPGEYTIQVLLNDQDVGKPVHLTVSASTASGHGATGSATATASQDTSMRDLVKVETAPAINVARKEPGQRYALLIGIGEYENSGVQRLKYPVEDVKALSAVLEDPDAGGFERANIHVLTNGQATLSAIGEQLVWLRGMSTGADTVFIYFTGHGYNNGNRSFLGTANADPDNLNFTALSVAKFNEAVGLIKAKKKIIVLDACHSGGMLIAARGDDKLTPKMLADLHERAEGEVRLLSCSQNETSKEDATLGHSVFTYFLVKGMGAERAADANKDGVVTVGELYEYLSRQVRRYGAEHGYIQTPTAEQKVTAGVIIMSTKWKR